MNGSLLYISTDHKEACRALHLWVNKNAASKFVGVSPYAWEDEKIRVEVILGRLDDPFILVSDLPGLEKSRQFLFKSYDHICECLQEYSLQSEQAQTIKAAMFRHDLANTVDEIIDMLPEDDTEHTALQHFVESYNLKFGTNFQLVPAGQLNFPIDRIQFHLNELKKLKG